MLPSWSGRAKKALALFFRQWNDIDVYVEDRSPSTVKVYHELFFRLTSPDFRISRVIPVGSKEEVLDACRNHTSARPSVYVVDGDLDLLLGSVPPSINRLYVHDRYCIENFLLDETTAVEIAYEDDPSMTREEIRNSKHLDDYRKEAELLGELFIMFALLKKYLPSVKTVSNSLTSFLDGKSVPRVDESKISAFVGPFHTQLCAIYGHDRIISDELILLERASCNNAALIFVSGKDFLLPLLVLKLRRISKTKVTHNTMRVRLAKYCNTDCLAPLRAKLVESSLLS